MDAFELFTKPTVPTPTNRSMTLYIQACREFFETKRCEAFVWTDTRDNVANVLTKFGQSGLLEIDDVLLKVYTTASWEPLHPFRWHSHDLVDPEPLVRVVLREPPPATKEMQKQQVAVPAVDLFHDPV